jgi:4-amino-4-deoxy-L-arabinose transferase-like glycosyltransferase
VGQAEDGALVPNLAFWSALGFGFLTKGPVAWIPAAVVLVADRVPQSSHQTRIRSRYLWLGLPVLLLILGSWGIPALIQSRGDFLSLGLGRHVIQRFVGSLDGHGSGSIAGYLLKLPYFGLTVWPSFFPGSIWIPWFLQAVWRQRNFDPLLRHCFWGLGLTFAVFTLCNTKLPHYLLPAFPWMAVAFAVVWTRSGRPAGPWLRWCGLAGASTAILALVFAEMGRQTLPARVLFEDVRRWPVGTRVAATEFREPSVVWYARAAGGAQVEFLEFGDAVEFLKRPGPRACLFQEAEFESWRRDAGLSFHTSAILRRFSGWNPVHGRRINLVLVRFTE